MKLIATRRALKTSKEGYIKNLGLLTEREGGTSFRNSKALDKLWRGVGIDKYSI